jgi:hypothetical protein
MDGRGNIWFGKTLVTLAAPKVPALRAGHFRHKQAVNATWM